MQHCEHRTVAGADEGRRRQLKGHGEKLTRRKEQAIAALLTEPTLEMAAKRVGVSDVTLWRWLRDSEFQAAFSEARHRVVEAAIGKLQQVAAEAVACLQRNLTSGQPATEVRAADAILSHVLKTLDRLELEQRLRHLEAAADAPGRRVAGA